MSTTTLGLRAESLTSLKSVQWGDNPALYFQGSVRQKSWYCLWCRLLLFHSFCAPYHRG